MIDTHAHFEPRLMDVPQVLDLMNQNQVEKMFLVPLMTNPPEPRKPNWMMAIQRFLFSKDILRPLGIFITKLMYKKGGQWNLGPLAYFMKAKTSSMEIVLEPDNQTVSSIVQKHPDRFAQWVMLNLNDPNVRDDFSALTAKKGVVGIKLHPFWHKFSLHQFDKIADLVEESRLPVNIHLGFGEAGDYEWLLENHPDITFIFGHLGVPYYKALWRRIKRAPHCYMDISSTYHVDEKLLAQAVECVGADRILFASDTPYTPPGSVHQLRSWVENLPITAKEKQKILHGNAERIFLLK
jgi:uncharacterized protein